MRHISSVVSSVAAAFVLLFTNGAAVASEPFERKQQPVTTEQVPAAVKATIEQELKGGAVAQLAQDTETRTYYEVQVTKNGKPSYIYIDPDGHTLKHESAKRHDRRLKEGRPL